MLDRLNAFLHCCDAESSTAGALSGITIGVKANIAVKGMPFHAGLQAWKNKTAGRDAQVVVQLREAGASIVGILNMDEGALGAKTDNPHFGPTQNPHRQGYSPGGSSGGSAAAVAAGLCEAALGTDTLGSVRIPAAHCGVYGFKPATTRVSQDNVVPANPMLDAIGALARNLDMLETVSRVISDFGDSALEGSGAQLIDHGVFIDPQVESTFNTALASLEQVPAEESMPVSLGRIRLASFTGVSKYMADTLTSLATSPALAKLLAFGSKRAPNMWAEDKKILAETRQCLHDFIRKHGFLILPTVPTLPFKHSEPEPITQADFTCLANIAGLPAISLPAGWTNDHLPIGVQLIGQSGQEAGLFKLARNVNKKLGAYRAPKTIR